LGQEKNEAQGRSRKMGLRYSGGNGRKNLPQFREVTLIGACRIPLATGVRGEKGIRKSLTELVRIGSMVDERVRSDEPGSQSESSREPGRHRLNRGNGGERTGENRQKKKRGIDHREGTQIDS